MAGFFCTRRSVCMLVHTLLWLKWRFITLQTQGSSQLLCASSQSSHKLWNWDKRSTHISLQNILALLNCALEVSCLPLQLFDMMSGNETTRILFSCSHIVELNFHCGNLHILWKFVPLCEFLSPKLVNLLQFIVSHHLKRALLFHFHI